MNKNKPTSPGIRWKVKIKKLENKYKIIKKLTIKKNIKAGRNNQGKITIRHRGGGVKNKIRIIDFKRNKSYIPAIIKTIEYDPNRNALISMLQYKDGEKRYILYVKNTKIGDKIINDKKEIKIGNAMKIKYIPIGTKICCIENIPKKGAIYARAAGSSFNIISKEKKYCIVKTKSDEIRKINISCKATIGEIGNQEFYLKKIGKAGIKRLKGIRPTVRGVAMNPVDHPHGGGEGKTSTKRHPVSFKGKKTKGLKTRKNKRTKKFIIKK